MRDAGPMLEMKDACEKCHAALPAAAEGAFICSFECTFCADCTTVLGDRCPNCSGVLRERPTRGCAN